jgi:cysteine-rich repeat protein
MMPCTPICGDSLLRGGEACDDGNLNDNDGCSSVCMVDIGYSCTTDEPSACTPICGDGLIRGGEACDDMNMTPGDGCSVLCSIEPGYMCTGEPSICTP